MVEDIYRFSNQLIKQLPTRWEFLCSLSASLIKILYIIDKLNYNMQLLINRFLMTENVQQYLQLDESNVAF